MRAQLDEQCVINANAQFWEQMLAMSLEPMPSAEKLSLGAGHIWGSVDLAGAWKGRIEVRLTGALAYEATAAMMMQALDTVAEVDALDATKEIANMIAGTIKSSLPRPCSMTVPSSSVQQQAFSAGTGTCDSITVAFRHATGELLVRVSEQELALA
jgi:CheY-specific phosphatase CheX